jgi:hypothetical protein
MNRRRKDTRLDNLTRAYGKAEETFWRHWRRLRRWCTHLARDADRMAQIRRSLAKRQKELDAQEVTP